MRQKSRIGIVVVVVVAALLIVGGLVLHHRHVSSSGTTSTTGATSTTVAAGSRAQGIYRWGDYIGGTGNKSTDDLVTPTLVPGTSNVVAIDAGNSSSYALECAGGSSKCKADGSVIAWGNGRSGQLGNGSHSNSFTQPVQVKFPAGIHIVSIGESRNNGYAIDQTGQGWGWGAGAVGSLCLGTSRLNLDAPVKVPGITDATAVQGGQDHVLWLLANKTVEACGENIFGQVGDGTLVEASRAVAVKGLSDVIQISSGNQSSAALTAQGQVYMWGRNTSGQIGVSSSAKKIDVPVLVKLPGNVIEIAAGGDLVQNGHTLALLSNHTVYGWGEDAARQLANDGRNHQRSPVRLTVPRGVVFVHVVAGGANSLALDSHGNVWSWGNGLEGEIGNSTDQSSSQPVMVDHDVSLISATANNVLDYHASG